VGEMSERGYGSGDQTSAINWINDRSGRHGEWNDNRPLPWDKEVKQVTNSAFASNVWEIMDEIGNLLITKQSDYGPGNVNNAFGGPINGLLVRIGDKFERLKNLFASGKEPKHESIEDSFKDMANYAVIALMIERGSWPK